MACVTAVWQSKLLLTREESAGEVRGRKKGEQRSGAVREEGVGGSGLLGRGAGRL